MVSRKITNIQTLSYVEITHKFASGVNISTDELRNLNPLDLCLYYQAKSESFIDNSFVDPGDRNIKHNMIRLDEDFYNSWSDDSLNLQKELWGYKGYRWVDIVLDPNGKLITINLHREDPAILVDYVQSQLHMMAPKYLPPYKPNQLTIGWGNPVVVTGWTLKEAIAKKLDDTDYAAIGQLYSATRGINWLARNIIANPQTRSLIVLGCTKADQNAGAVQCLIDLFDKGFYESENNTGSKCWKVNSDIEGFIDIEVDEKAIYDFIECVELVVCNSIYEVVEETKKRKVSPHEPWNNGEARNYPVVTHKPTVFPGKRYGHVVEGKTIAETWVKIIQRIKTTGTIRSTQHDTSWQELIDFTAVVTNEPDSFYFPEPNYLPISRDFIDSYSSQMIDDAEPQEGVKYTYGQRMRSHFGIDQIERLIDKLADNPDSSRAVINLWDADEDNFSSNPPCLNHIWVRIVNDELSMTATFRSNDMFSAWPANAMGLRALQKHIFDRVCERGCFELDMGPLITVSQSAHIYEECMEHADRMIANQYKEICNQRNYDDPCGNMIITVEDNIKISITHTTSGSGEAIAEYEGKNPLTLIRKIASSCPAIQPEHIGYLGIELQKAAQCIKDGVPYTQDR